MKTARPIILRKGMAHEVPLADGRRIKIAWWNDASREALLGFYRGLPEENRHYLKADVTNQVILDRLIEEMHEGGALMILAWDGDRIVGETTQHFVSHGWTRHVSELRPLLMPQYEGHSILDVMIGEQVEAASEMGLDKVVVRLLEVQKDRRRMLEDLGFVLEATLAGHATDLQGRRHDMLIMSNTVVDLWRRMEDLIRETDSSPMPPEDM